MQSRMKTTSRNRGEVYNKFSIKERCRVTKERREERLPLEIKDLTRTQIEETIVTPSKETAHYED